MEISDLKLLQIRVHEALVSGEEQSIASVEQNLRDACEQLRARISTGNLARSELQALSADCQRLSRLLTTAGEFFRGLSSAMRVEMQGYGSIPFADPGQSTSRLVVEA